MKHLLPDVRLATRALVRAPTFTLTSALTLAIGIAGLTVVFAVTDALLLRPLPVHQPGDLVTMELRREDGRSGGMLSLPQYEILRRDHRGFTDLTAFGMTDYAVATPGTDAETAFTYEVAPNYFSVLGIAPALGTFFTAATDDLRNSEATVVISHDLWQSRYDGDRNVIGTPLHVNGHPLTIVGVAPAGFRGTISVVPARIWVPIALVPTLREAGTMYRPGGMHWLTLIGRLAPDTDRRQAEALQTAVVRSVMAGEQDVFDPRTGLRTERAPIHAAVLSPLRGLPQSALGPAAGFMAVLFVAALLVLLIASVNITSIMLARLTARSRELAVRRSIGASRVQLAAQLLAENALLFMAGAALGLLLAVWALSVIPLLLALSPVEISLELPVDGRLIGFAAATALALSTLFGLPPALHGAAASETALLSATRPGRRGTRMRSALVVTQVAFSLVLLISAGLLTRALQRALAVDPGFDATGVVIADIELGTLGYDAQRSRTFFDQLTARLEAHPAVERTGLASIPPLIGYSTMQLRPEGQQHAPTDGIDVTSADGGFVETLRVPLVAGRNFDSRDVIGAPQVAIVNEAFVQRYWPGEKPIGKLLYAGPTGEERPIEVVGVTRTGRYRNLNEAERPFIYQPFTQGQSTSAYVFVRGVPGAAGVEAILRAEVRALDPAVPLRSVGSFQRTISLLLAPQRIGAMAIGMFGVIGLLLAAVGIYGLMAFTVAQRTREIGIRMAVGAQSGHVIRIFLHRAGTLLVIGTVAGVLLALGGAHLIAALLYGVSPTDPLTFIGVPILLVAVALFAAYLPARRASRTDPLVVLRTD
jgi:predicted permease